jgi:hypothetical protein
MLLPKLRIRHARSFFCSQFLIQRGDYMAIFHLTHSFVRRSKGSSSVAIAAYNAGQKLEDGTGSTAYSDYTRKGGILYDEITLPSGAPAWANNRGELWRRLEAREDKSTRHASAVLAHNFNIALPHELTLEQNIFLARDFVREQFIRKGYAVDWAIHSPDPRGDSRNIHLHILVPQRKIEGESFGKKTNCTSRQLSEQVRAWRKSWATLMNRHLKRYGHKKSVDERSLRAQGLSRKPTKHHGKQSKVRRNRLDSIRPLQPKSPVVKTIKHINPDGSIRIRKAIKHTGLNNIGQRSSKANDDAGYLAPIRPALQKGLSGSTTITSANKQVTVHNPDNSINIGGVIHKSFVYSINNKTNHVTSKQVDYSLNTTAKINRNSSNDQTKPVITEPNFFHRGGWPQEAVADWKSWGFENPARFFAKWPELAPTGFTATGGLHA